MSRYLRATVALLVGMTLFMSASGCASSLFSMPPSLFSGKLPGLNRDKDQDKDDEDNDFETRVETPLLNEYVSVSGNSYITLRGVGLVTGLNGTGGDPAPTPERAALAQEMQRRGVAHPNRILASRDTAMVLVVAYLPAMVREGDRFDVRVVLPPKSGASSLKGGWLMSTYLFEEQNVAGEGRLKGHEYATAEGAILTSIGVNNDPARRQGELMQGSIPGGAVSKTSRDLSVILRSSKRDTRNSARIANAISNRFHDYDRYGQRIAMAEAKTDTLINLKVFPSYRNNFPRYQAVIRSIALSETDIARRLRTEQLAKDLLVPERAMIAAIRLEAIGEDAIPFLIDGLDSPDLEVRFHAAQALAYLKNDAGIDVLISAVRDEPALRVYALAALSVVDDADAVTGLRDLMNVADLETRYGALVALKELDRTDPALRTRTYDGGFSAHLIESSGEPMIHVRRYRIPEVVVFGANQPFRLPLRVMAGDDLGVIGHVGGNTVEVVRYAVNKEPVRRTVPNSMQSILDVLGELGATYPDIVQMMIEAERQHSFVGQFGIERMPRAGRVYVADASSDTSDIGEESDERRIGSDAQTPGLFETPATGDESIDDEERQISPLEAFGIGESAAADSPAEEEAQSPDTFERHNLVSADSDGAVDSTDSQMSSGESTRWTDELSEPAADEETDGTSESDTPPWLADDEPAEPRAGFGDRVRRFFRRSPDSSARP